MSDIYNSAPQYYRSRTQTATATDLRAKGPAVVEWSNPKHSVTLKSGLPLSMTSGIPDAPIDTSARQAQLALKRLLIDIPLSAMALIVLSPLLVGLALSVRLSSRGPALFRQKRVGLNGREFYILKFRSMRTESGDHTGLRQTVAADERVTRIGRFMRATSLDELPQLWNILVGDMAIIGPRPMVPGQLAGGVEYNQVVPYYDYRHRVKPGLSGWAQANGLRGPTTDVISARDRIEHDCAYVQNFSLALDIRIILQTLTREFLTGSGV
jgi:lipopolysaccharide/colanic/teichoic acid biosynthesis glycosyltransferase